MFSDSEVENGLKKLELFKSKILLYALHAFCKFVPMVTFENENKVGSSLCCCLHLLMSG